MAFPLEVPRLSEEELLSLAQSIVSGETFTSIHLQQIGRLDAAEEVFIPLRVILIAYSHCIKDVGFVYERLKKAVGHREDGLPIFETCYVTHADDSERIKDAMVRLLSFSLDHARRN